MCGRAYITYTAEELELRYQNRKGWLWPIVAGPATVLPDYNIAPTRKLPILCLAEGSLGFRSMRWGLVPGWAKSVKDADKYSMINAKAEEIAEKRSYKAAFQQRRCIVPLSGFFEWKGEKKEKIPFAISGRDQPILSLAGIWEQWSGSSSEDLVESFAIVTRSANEFMANIHARMPVILTADQEQSWLDNATGRSELDSIMLGDTSQELTAWQVSSEVNSVRNNCPDLLTPQSSRT